MRRACSVSLLAALSGLVPACGVGKSGDTVSGSLGSAGAPETAVVAAAPAWKIGERYTYSFELSSALAFGEQPNAFDFDLTGSVIVAPSRAATREATLFVVLENPKIQSRVADPRGQFSALAEQLARFGCFFVLQDGRVSEMRLAPGLPAMVVSIYRQVGALLQVASPSAPADRFETREYDGTGEYLAAYRRVDGQTWSKRKLKYLRLLGNAGGMAAPVFSGLVPDVFASTGEIQLSREGRPLKVRLQEDLRVRGAQLPLRSATTASLNAHSTARGAPVLDWQSLGEKLTRLGADEPYARPASIESLDDARINGATFESAVEKLRQAAVAHNLPSVSSAADANAVRVDAVDKQESAQFVALAAIFRNDPRAVAKAVRSVSTDPAMANILIDALGSSGSSAAHEALARMLTAKGLEPKLRLRALTGLARTPVPTPVAVQALRDELARDTFSTGALYGLGSYAMYYRDAGNMREERALGELLVERLSSAEDIVARLIVTLGGIANSGYAGAFNAVVPHLSDRRPAVRAASMRALQSIPGDHVDVVLASAITSDADASVSLAALSSAQIREPSDSLASAVKSAAESGGDPTVRFRSVELLSKWEQSRPELRAVIQRVAVSDPEERVRSLAQSLL